MCVRVLINVKIEERRSDYDFVTTKERKREIEEKRVREEWKDLEKRGVTRKYQIHYLSLHRRLKSIPELFFSLSLPLRSFHFEGKPLQNYPQSLNDSWILWEDGIH